MSEAAFEKFAVGQSVSRTEDPRLLRGEGCFTDDFELPRQGHAYVFRSPYAHGRIKTLDVAEARSASGVLMVLTAAKLDEDGQLISGSYMDYAMPRAGDLPAFTFGSHPTHIDMPATSERIWSLLRNRAAA